MSTQVAAPGRTGASEPRSTVQVVPVRGLPLVAVALISLVVAIVGNWLWALDFFHVVAGGLWTAIDLFAGLVAGPILARLSPAEFAARAVTHWSVPARRRRAQPTVRRRNEVTAAS